MAIKPDLNGHTALVKGGSRGIGAAIAAALAEAGAAVAVNYRERADEAEAVIAKIKSMGGRAIATAAVSQAAAVAMMVDHVASTPGSEYRTRRRYPRGASIAYQSKRTPPDGRVRIGHHPQTSLWHAEGLAFPS
jgi:NAD(P)-dependent dehydrogenase (short-subunit alcohol dehydrogenase family)